METKSAKKIGILGGTFNPIHNGHILLAKTAYMSEKLDEVIFMPSGKSYLKSQMQVLNADERYHLISLAIREETCFSVSDMEIMRPGNTYTYETLLELKQLAPLNTYYFIIGADNLFSIEYWKEPAIIFSNCILLVAVRDDKDIAALIPKIEELKTRFNADIHLLPFKNTPISSTEIRQRIAKGESISEMVPQNVEHYIINHNLYRNDL